MRLSRCVAIAAVVSGLLLGLGISGGEEAGASAQTASGPTIEEKAIVEIVAFFFDVNGEYLTHKPGSGVVVHSTGTILTNVHVIRAVTDQGCTITKETELADLLAILVTDPEKPADPPKPRFAVDLHEGTGEALPAEAPELDLAVIRINREIRGERAPQNLEELIEAVKSNALELATLGGSPNLPALPLWDAAAIEERQDVHLGGYPAISTQPRLTFTEGPVLEKRPDGTMLVDRAFATFGFSGGALIEKRSGFLVGILCGGQSIETPAGPLVLAMGRALDARAQEFLNKVPEVQRRPVPRFTFTPSFPKPGEVVTFDASASFDPDGQIAKFEWDLDGDGQADAEGIEVQHAFTNDSRVMLVVTDNDGLKAQRRQRLILDRQEQLRQAGEQCKPVLIEDRPFETIQAAIDAAEPEDTITVGPGTCQENLRITKSLTLRGAGRDQTILLGDGRAPVIAVCPREASGESACPEPVEVHIEGFTVRNGLYALQALANAKVSIRECDLLESLQQGVDAAFRVDITLVDNLVAKNDEEGFVLEGGRAELRGNTISENGDEGVLIKNLRTHTDFIQAEAQLDGNEIRANSGFGVFITQQAQVQIQGGQISLNGSNGLEVNEQASIELMSIEIVQNIKTGVWLFDSVAQVKDIKVISNDHEGIYISGWAQATMSGSQISHNRSYGIKMQDSAQASITNCQLLDNHEGISMWGLSQATISNSDVSNNRDSGISMLSSAKATISISQLRGNREHGIAIWSSALATIENNVIQGNKECGIFSDSDKTVQGRDNRMLDNGVDLCLNASASLRSPLVPETAKTQLSFPGPYSTLQETIDALAPGGIIMIAAGEYPGGLTIWKPLTLRGAGWEETKIEGAVSLISGVEGVQLEGMTITGSALQGFLMGGQGQAAIFACRLSGNDAGIYIQGFAKVMISDSEVSGNKWSGITIVDFAQAAIYNSRISGHRHYGVLIRGSARVVLSNSQISGNSGYAEILIAGLAQAKISNCEVSRTGNERYGIAIEDSAQATIIGSQISASKEAGIFIEGSAQVTITSSKISANKYHGIAMEDFAQAEISDSFIDSNGEGIDMWDLAQAKITRSTIDYNEGVGIDTGAQVRLTITDSSVSFNGSGIELWHSAQATISSSRLSNNKANAIFVAGAARVTITGSEISSNGWEGISIGRSAQATISNSDISGNAKGGIIMFDSAQAVFSNSHLLSNNEFGIFIWDSAEVTIIDSQISDNGDYGIWIEDSAQATVTGSQVSGSGVGIYMEYSAQSTIVDSRASGNVDGIYMEDSARVTITNSMLSNNEGDGIFMGDWTQAIISNCQIWGNGRGIVIWDSAQADIRDSSIQGNGASEACKKKDHICNGLTLCRMSQVKITHSTILNNADWGVVAVLKQCGWNYDDFAGEVSFEKMELEDISGNNTTGNQNGMGNPGNHPWNRPDVPDGQVCLP